MSILLSIIASTTLFTAPIKRAAQDVKTSFIPENEIFVGLDSLEKFTAGNFSGLPNPNYGRLTLLYAHQYDGKGEVPISSSHFHPKATLILKGDAKSAIISPSGGYYLPEGTEKLRLMPGGGVYSGFMVSGLEKTAISNLTFRPVQWLNRAGAKEWESVLAKNGSRWTGDLSKAKLALEVVSLTTGLMLLNADSSVAADAYGKQLPLGGGNFAFKPVFAVKKDSSPGVYSAMLRLRDLEGIHLESGVFELRFEVKTVGSPFQPPAY